MTQKENKKEVGKRLKLSRQSMSSNLTKSSRGDDVATQVALCTWIGTCCFPCMREYDVLIGYQKSDHIVRPNSCQQMGLSMTAVAAHGPKLAPSLSIIGTSRMSAGVGVVPHNPSQLSSLSQASVPDATALSVKLRTCFPGKPVGKPFGFGKIGEN